MKTRFVMIFPGRTGSTFLKSAMAKHPAIHMEGERLGIGPNKDDPDRQEQWLRWLYEVPDRRAVGFKTKLRQASDLDRFFQVLQEYRVDVIAMYRRNLVKWAVSSQRGRVLHSRTGHWNVFTGEPLPPIEIAVDRMEMLLKRIEAWDREQRDFVSRLNPRLFEVTYEELLADRAGTFARMLQFLRVFDFPLRANTAKNSPDDLRRAVTNFDELRRHFEGTKYETMFDEGG